VVFERDTIVDVNDKKVLHPFKRAQLLTVEGTNAYFFKDNGNEAGDVIRYNLVSEKSEKVAKMGEGRWGLSGIKSPDGTKAIGRELKNTATQDGYEMSYKLILEQVGMPRVSLGEFAATCGATGGGGVVPEPPGVWFDNNRFVTQTTLGKVVVLNAADKSQTKLVDIPLTHKVGEKVWETIGAMGFTPLGLQQPRFSLLPDGRVVYEADLVYFIDVAKKSWEKATWRPLGHGFEYSAVPDKIVDDDRYSKTVTVSLRYRDKVIGHSETVWWTTPNKPLIVVTEGHLALIERTTQPGKPIPLDTVRVWTSEAGWSSLNGWADSVIGWTK
jgi:hypothetical protein